MSRNRFCHGGALLKGRARARAHASYNIFPFRHTCEGECKIDLGFPVFRTVAQVHVLLRVLVLASLKNSWVALVFAAR